MIDLVKAKKAFNQYIKDYNCEQGNIKLKIIHTFKTIEASEYIAKSLKLDFENIQLAKLIALLHDIGRFEQRKQKLSFEDYTGFDHAKYGVKILFEDNLIRNFIEEDIYDDIIYKAIINHNKYSIDNNLSDNELLHAKIIRDADKLDNFRVKEVEYFGNMFDYNKDTISYESISDKVFKDFMDYKCILSTERITQIDIWISYIAFIYDLNFKASFKHIKENKSINKLIDRIEYKNEETKLKMEQIRKCANDYIESNLS